jgi:TonB family protein
MNKKFFLKLSIICALFTCSTSYVALYAMSHFMTIPNDVDYNPAPLSFRNTIDFVEIIDNPDGMNPEVFTVVEKMPQFPGGDQALLSYISQQIKYPEAALNEKKEGRVITQFVVNTDGSVSDVVIKKGFGYGSEEEATRVISNMPKWTPGEQNGKKVAVQYTLPITFKLK